MGQNHKQFTIKKSSYYRSQTAYRNFALGLFSFLCAYLVTSVLTPIKQSDAAQLLDITNDSTGYYVRIAGSSTLSIPVTATPTGQLAGATDTITTTTNSPKGYKLYISASPNYLYLDGDPDTSGRGKFSPIGGSLSSPLALGQNTWGFAYNTANTGVVASNFAAASNYTSAIPSSNATYTSVPTTETMIQSIDEANIPNGTDLDIYFGIKASTALPSGSYQGQITYTALSDGVTGNIMQDFTTAECQALPVATADNYDTAHIELVDSRDLKWYSVAHMADGNCWMTSNLALDGGITLTPSDSDVTQNRELPASANITDGTTSVYDSPQIYTANQDSTTTDCGSYEYCVISDVKYGNLYNWNAATATTGKQATTGTAYESICPKGWRLPDNGGSGVNKTWGNLVSKYTVNLDGTGTALSPTNINDGADSGAMVKRVQQAPFNLALPGIYQNSPLAQGQNAIYWSRTVYGGNTVLPYNFYINSQEGNFRPQGALHHKDRAASVRCVFQGSTVENNMYMQDINLTMCNNLAESTTTSDNRRTVIDGRDGESYKISHLADGNCWMTQNLRHNGGTSVANQSGYDGRLYLWDSNISGSTVCPSGWVVPPNSGTKSYYNLFQYYTQNMATAEAAPLYFSRAGLYYGSGYDSQGSSGYYWSSTGYDSSDAYGLLYNSSGVFSTQNNYNRAYYRSIRCVFGS